MFGAACNQWLSKYSAGFYPKKVVLLMKEDLLKLKEAVLIAAVFKLKKNSREYNKLAGTTDQNTNQYAACHSR